jgi:uncharacterized protein (DUF58 family)
MCYHPGLHGQTGVVQRVPSSRDRGSLPAELFERLHYVELYTGRVMRNALMGDYKSPIRGQGFNFDQHKKYQRGDDYRQIDWNVLARLQEVFVKKKLEDKELHAIVVTDLSRSMDLTTGGRSKHDVLMEVAATLAFSAAADHISVGMLAFAGDVEHFVAPAKGQRQAWKILEDLWRLEPSTPETDLHRPLEFLNARLKKASLIFYLSDFIGLQDIFESASLRILLKRHDLVPFIIEDPLDVTFPGTRGYINVRDVESRRTWRVRTSPRERRRSEARIQEHRDHLRVSFYRLGLDHLWLRTDEPCVQPVLEFFLNRKRRR